MFGKICLTEGLRVILAWMRYIPSWSPAYNLIKIRTNKETHWQLPLRTYPPSALVEPRQTSNGPVSHVAIRSDTQSCRCSLQLSDIDKWPGSTFTPGGGVGGVAAAALNQSDYSKAFPTTLDSGHHHPSLPPSLHLVTFDWVPVKWPAYPLGLHFLAVSPLCPALFLSSLTREDTLQPQTLGLFNDHAMDSLLSSHRLPITVKVVASLK